ncbi:hypothetical protein N7524_006025 [Penicillium chrysogenum]|nr:hypothetical protein N7524_006025 [Penicillium chrysogenum]
MLWSNTAGGYGASLDSFDDDGTTAFMLPENSEAVRHLIASFDNFVKSHRRAHGLTGAHVSRETRDQILEYRGSQERTPWPRQESGSPPHPSVNTCPTSSNQELLDLLRESEELGLSPPSHVQESSISLSPPPSLSSFSTSSASSSIQPLPRNAFSSKPQSPDTRPPILAPTTALSIISSPVFAAAFDKIIRRDPGRT